MKNPEQTALSGARADRCRPSWTRTPEVCRGLAERLQAEGVKVHNNQVVDFDVHFWDPSTEL